MKTTRTKRFASGLLAGVLALSLVSGMSLPARAAGKTDDETLSRLESVPRETPRDPFGFRSGSSGVSLMGTYPASFDLRHIYVSEEYPDVSFVTPVKLQNPFGTCWGFAVIAAAEVSLLTSGIAGQEGFTAAAEPEKGWRELDLSEKHLAYFVHETYHGFADDDPHSQNGEGCVFAGDPESSDRFDTGGMAFYATGLFASGTGPVLEYGDEQMAYHGKYKTIQYRKNDASTPRCYSEDDDWNIDMSYRNAQSYVLKESYLLPVAWLAEDEEGRTAANNAIKEQLRMGRAVQIGIHADTSSPNQEQTSHYINTENWAHYTYDGSLSNHCVCIVGWDDNYPRENFAHRLEDMDDAEAFALTTPARDGAWLAKNSWGSGENEFPNRDDGEWGLFQGQDRGVWNEETGKYEYNAVEDAKQTGYFWISYEDTSLNMPEALAFESATAREGYFLYQYDYMPVSSVNAYDLHIEVSMANVFTAATPGRLDAVSCQTTTPGTTVIYEVYLLPAEADGWLSPTDGVLAARAEGTYEYGGFHKAKLDTPVFLGEGQQFSVVVTQVVPDGTGCRYGLCAQTSVNEKGLPGADSYGKGVINENESFFSMYDADKGVTEWFDICNEYIQDWLKNAGEYNDCFDIDNFPIKAYVASLAPAAKRLTYTGEEQTLITPSSVTLEGYTAEYRTGDGETWSDWSTELPAGTEVGSYIVETRYVGSDDVISVQPVAAVIRGIPVVITAKDQTIHIGDDTPAWNDSSYTVEGPEGVSLAVKPDVHYEIYQKDKKAGETVEVSKDTVRDYNIVPSGAVLDVEDESIYQIYYQSGVLTVTGEPVTVRARDVTINAGDPVPAWTADSYTVEGMAEGDSLDLDITVKYYTMAGDEISAEKIDTGKIKSYEITPRGDRVCGKYVVSYKSGTLTVAEASEPVHHGGGGAAVANPVTVPASSTVTGGTVKSSAANARAGEKVTVTPEPDEGYVTTGVTVTDAKGNNVPVTRNADGTYSFTMPATAVTITPTFEEAGGQPADSGDVSSRFKDVPTDAWYHDAVQWAVDCGLMNGVSNDAFAPNDNTTRAMVVTMLWRMAGEPVVNEIIPYTDVPEDMWYTEAIRWAASTGAVTGMSADTFSPNEPVTREQLAAILYRYAQAQCKGFTGSWMFLLDYPDAASVSEWADEAMHWMVMHGVINGMNDGTLAPKANATRAQIATMFMRFAAEMEK